MMAVSGVCSFRCDRWHDFSLRYAGEWMVIEYKLNDGSRQCKCGTSAGRW